MRMNQEFSGNCTIFSRKPNMDQYGGFLKLEIPKTMGLKTKMVQCFGWELGVPLFQEPTIWSMVFHPLGSPPTIYSTDFDDWNHQLDEFQHFMATDRTPQSTNLCRNRVFLPYSWFNRFIGEKQIHQVGCNQQLGVSKVMGVPPVLINSRIFQQMNSPASLGILHDYGNSSWIYSHLILIPKFRHEAIDAALQS